MAFLPLFFFAQNNLICDDLTACNFDSEGDCIYPEEGFDCDGNQIITISGCKIEDNDCNGDITDGDNYLSGWTINWDNGYEMGYIVTDNTGCYSIDIPIPPNFEGFVTISEQSQDDYVPFNDNDTYVIQVDLENLEMYEVNFFNCPSCSMIEYENLGTGENEWGYTKYSTFIDGYKFLDNDCNCEFSEGDEPLANWPILISAGYPWQSSDMQAPIVELTTDENGYWSYCLSSDEILNVTNGENPEYFTISEEMLDGYYPCQENMIYPQKFHSTGLMSHDSNILTNGVAETIPFGTKFNFFNCPSEVNNVIFGYKYLDNDCNGEYSDGDEKLSGWEINWNNGVESGSVITNNDGYYSFEVGSDAAVDIWEENQNGYYAFNGEDSYVIQIDMGNPSDYQVNFFNCPQSCQDVPEECFAELIDTTGNIIGAGLNVSTGYNNNTGLKMNPLQNDPEWVITMSPLGANVTTPVAATVIDATGMSWDCAWDDPTTSTNGLGTSACDGSMWISPAANDQSLMLNPGNMGNSPINGGIDPNMIPYRYEYCFCVCGSGNVIIDLDVSADNYAELILIDENDITITNLGELDLGINSFGGWDTGPMNDNFYNANTMYNSVYLEEGTYCIIADVYDMGSSAGLKVEGTITTDDENGGISTKNSICCDPKIFISGTKFIDANCDGIIDLNGGDYLGVGWTINLSDEFGNTWTTTTDSSGIYSFQLDQTEFSGNFTVQEENQDGFTAYTSDSFNLDNLGLNGPDGIVQDFINCPDSITESCPIECVAVNGLNISTGYNNPINPNDNGTLMNPGENDPSWILTATPDIGVNVPIPATVIAPCGNSWDCNDATACPTSNLNDATPTSGAPFSACNAMWLSPYASHLNQNDNMNNPDIDGGLGNADTPYRFENRFCVCEADTITIDLEVTADNYAELVLYDETNLTTTNIGELSLISSGAGWSNSMNSNFYSPTNMSLTTFLQPGTYVIIANTYNDGNNSLGLKIEGTISSTNGFAVENTLCCNPKIFISGTKFIDANCDGIIDLNGGDYLGVGWTITLSDEFGNTWTTTTDANGTYSFELDQTEFSGNFTVQEENQDGFTAYTSDSFNLDNLGLNGPDGIVQDFINCPTLPTDTTATVCVYKVQDLDCDGIYGESDVFLSEWEINWESPDIDDDGVPEANGSGITTNQGWCFDVPLSSLDPNNPIINIWEESQDCYSPYNGINLQQLLIDSEGIYEVFFYNCLDSIIIEGYKIIDNDTNGSFSDGDQYGVDWEINCEGFSDTGTVFSNTTQTNTDGFYSFSIPGNLDINTVLVWEEEQTGFFPCSDDSVMFDVDSCGVYTVNFFNCPVIEPEDPDTCAIVLEQSIYCEGNTYYLNLAMQNTTNAFDFVQYTLVPMDPNIQSSPTYYDDLWLVNNTNIFDIEIYNVPEDQDSICFFFSAFSEIENMCVECCSDTICLDISDGCIGLDDSSENGYLIFPNPANEKIIIQSNFLTNYNYSLYDNVGKQVFKKSNNEKEYLEMINVSHLVSGIYMLIIEDQNHLPMQYKIVIQK